jgi:periplasmic protein TonB
MAYVDASARARINPAAVAVTIGMNALFLVGIASISPSIGAEDYFNTPVAMIDEPDPVVKTPVTKMDPVKTPSPPIVTAPPRNDYVTPLPPVDFGPIIKLDPIVPPQPPYVAPPIPPLPPAPAAILTSARVDSRYVAAPSAMVRQEIEGVAKVKVLIGVDGHVKDVINLGSDNQEFFEATRKQALNKWRFKPATRDGVAIEGWSVQTVKFLMPKRFD